MGPQKPNGPARALTRAYTTPPGPDVRNAPRDVNDIRRRDNEIGPLSETLLTRCRACALRDEPSQISAAYFISTGRPTASEHNT